MDVKKPVQKVVVWAKANPVMAGLLLVGVIALGYLASKNKGKMSAVPTGLVDDAAGAGIMGGGEDELAPLTPYVDFDPVSGFFVNGNGYVDPIAEPAGDTIYSWVDEIIDPIIDPFIAEETTRKKTDPYYAPAWDASSKQDETPTPITTTTLTPETIRDTQPGRWFAAADTVRSLFDPPGTPDLPESQPKRWLSTGQAERTSQVERWTATIPDPAPTAPKIESRGTMTGAELTTKRTHGLRGW